MNIHMRHPRANDEISGTKGMEFSAVLSQCNEWLTIEKYGRELRKTGSGDCQYETEAVRRYARGRESGNGRFRNVHSEGCRLALEREPRRIRGLHRYHDRRIKRPEQIDIVCRLMLEKKNNADEGRCPMLKPEERYP